METPSPRSCSKEWEAVERAVKPWFVKPQRGALDLE